MEIKFVNHANDFYPFISHIYEIISNLEMIF